MIRKIWVAALLGSLFLLTTVLSGCSGGGGGGTTPVTPSTQFAFIRSGSSASPAATNKQSDRASRRTALASAVFANADSISVVNNDGTGEKTVLQNGTFDAVQLSLDGKKMVYEALVGGKFQVFVANADGSNPVQITNAPGEYDIWSPQISPDGSQVIFVKSSTQYIAVIAKANSTGGTLTELPTPGIYPDDPSFSNDGRILFEGTTSATEDHLYIMNADGTNIKQITDVAGVEDAEPSASSDNTMVAFERNNDIYLLSTSTQNDTPLTTTAGSYDPLFVTSKIIFISTRDGHPNLYSMNPDGSGVTQLTNDASAKWFDSCHVPWGYHW